MILDFFNAKINIILIHFQVKNTYHNPRHQLKERKINFIKVVVSS
jgi:hypothetical protein